MVQWQDVHHSALDVASLYAVLALRSEVFVVEQACAYQDVDGQDLQHDNRHVLGWDGDILVACARILKNPKSNRPIAIGRIAVAPHARGQALGRRLMEQALLSCEAHWPEDAVYLSAQAHLQRFYGSLGFAAITDVFEEDGILHIGMLRAV